MVLDKSTESGAVLYPEIKISLGTTVGSATLLNGRCLIKGKIFASKSLSIIIPRLAELNFASESGSNSFALPSSTVTSMLSMTLLAPNRIELTTPLAGDAHFTSGLSLS